MSDDPALEETVRGHGARAHREPGRGRYLGPFPKDVRLTANWDLWGTTTRCWR